MSVDPVSFILLVLLVLLALTGGVAWAVVRTIRLIPNEESPLGWLRLLASFGALALLPIWGLAAAFVLYAEYELEGAYLGRAVLLSGMLVLEGAALVVALALVVRGGLHLISHHQHQRAVRRYEALVGEGGVLQEDAWERAVLEVTEE